jgi:ferric-dicitrate binding protein FerR (iron transport regulator)
LAAIYSTRFVEQAITATSANAYTVGTGFVAVIRDISVFITGTGATATVLRSGGSAIMFRATSAAANDYVHQEGRWVLNAGEILEIAAAGTGAIEFNICGYLLSST